MGDGKIVQKDQSKKGVKNPKLCGGKDVSGTKFGSV